MKASSMLFFFSFIFLLCSLLQPSHSIKILVDGVSKWKNPTVHIGDSIVFKHKYHYNLYIFQNQRAFNVCNFTQATLLNKSNSTSYTWQPSRPGFFYFTFNNGSFKACQASEKLAIKVFTPPSESSIMPPEVPPLSAPAPSSGGVVSSSPLSPTFPWPFQPHQAATPTPAPTASSPLNVPSTVPDKGGGMPFINSNPAVPLPTGEVDSATIRPLPTSGHGGKKMEGLLFTEKTLIVIRVSAMDVEFGLKLTKTMDDLASFADFQLSKGRAGPVFLSREDVNMFILTVHLRGFKKENINIKISEDGTQITVHAEKPVQQTVMIGRMVHKEWTELKVFRKVFKIPDGVVLDLIKAGFKEEGSILTIIMPKQEKGIHGVGVEEVKEEEVGRVTAKSEREVVVADEFAERDKVGVRIKKEYEVPKIKTIEADHVVEKEIDRWGSKKTQTVEDAPRKNLIGERIHWKKPVAEEFPKKEYIGKTLPEKTEEPKVESTEETDRAVKEPLKREKETREPVSKLAEETKHQEVSTIEPMLVEPRNETATPRKELPALIEQRKKQEIPEVEKVEQRGLEEEKSIKDEGRQKIPQEPQRQVSHTDVTDSMKSKPDQELEQAATPQLQYPAEQHGKDEVTEREKTSSIGDEILEASNERSSQEKEGESSEAERQKDLGEGAAQEKKVASTRCKLFAPCVVAGSAILVSFIALVIHSAKRRQVKSA